MGKTKIEAFCLYTCSCGNEKQVGVADIKKHLAEKHSFSSEDFKGESQQLTHLNCSGFHYYVNEIRMKDGIILTQSIKRPK